MVTAPPHLKHLADSYDNKKFCHTSKEYADSSITPRSKAVSLTISTR